MNNDKSYAEGVADSIRMLIKLISCAEECEESCSEEQIHGMKKLLSAFVCIGTKELGINVTKCAYIGFDENGDEIHGDLVTGEIQRPYKEQ